MAIFPRRALGAALLSAAFVAAALSPSSAAADEIEQSIAAALQAYQEGDVALAKEELDYAAQLLAQAKAEGLTGFLPAPMEGWTRELGDGQAMGAAMFGGGVMAQADYMAADGRQVSIQMMADNPMVASMAAMFASPAAMGAMGKLERIGRQKVVITHDGDVQALVAGRVMLQIDGDAPVADKIAYAKAVDFRALGDF